MKGNFTREISHIYARTKCRHAKFMNCEQHCLPPRRVSNKFDICCSLLSVFMGFCVSATDGILEVWPLCHLRDFRREENRLPLIAQKYGGLSRHFGERLGKNSFKIVHCYSWGLPSHFTVFLILPSSFDLKMQIVISSFV